MKLQLKNDQDWMYSSTLRLLHYLICWMHRWNMQAIVITYKMWMIHDKFAYKRGLIIEFWFTGIKCDQYLIVLLMVYFGDRQM